ncbi:MAG: hypothetical protein JW712_08245 [Dehalococcoidales bacterium]|nr:hypothetical protein [Dehalococcoidales bacterium]
MARFEITACELCGEDVEPGSVRKHYIVPKEIMEQARMRRAKIVRVCPKCSTELQNWYNAKVDKNTFDSQIKKFRQRLPAEMVKEYEGAYSRFARYKKSQRMPV